MNKLEAAKRLKELATEAFKPWSEVHGLVLKMDGSHNRIWGLGIKHHTMKLCDSLRQLANSYIQEHDREQKDKYINIEENVSDIEVSEVE